MKKENDKKMAQKRKKSSTGDNRPQILNNRRSSIRYLAFEKQFHDDDSDNDSDADDVEKSAENALNSQEIGKVLPQTDDLAWIHLINWLDEDSDVHICQYIISSFKKYSAFMIFGLVSKFGRFWGFCRQIETIRKAILKKKRFSG